MTLKTRLRRTDPTGAEPQPPMTLPDGHWIGFDYPGRIAPLTRRELRPWHRLFLAGIRLGAKDTYDYTCFLVTVRLGRVFPLHTLFFSQLLQHGRIPQADSERIVIRVAWRMGCQYEFAHHTGMALELGVPRSEIETLTHEDDDGWSDRTRALMTAADELLATKNLSADVRAAPLRTRPEPDPGVLDAGRPLRDGGDDARRRGCPDRAGLRARRPRLGRCRPRDAPMMAV